MNPKRYWLKGALWGAITGTLFLILFIAVVSLIMATDAKWCSDFSSTFSRNVACGQSVTCNLCSLFELAIIPLILLDGVVIIITRLDPLKLIDHFLTQGTASFDFFAIFGILRAIIIFAFLGALLGLLYSKFKNQL